jgi:esterase FrsA
LKEKAIEWLSSSFEKGDDPLDPFLQAQIELIETLVAMEVIDSKKIILSGLSRGGLIACLVAAKLPICRRVLAYAPLTKLSQAKEFHKMQYDPRVMQYDLSNYVSLLGSKKLRFYIGNHDRRVHTSYAFELISSCASYAFEHRLKRSSHELIIGNSIGYEGHGTAEATFKEGALWMFEELFYHE